MTYFPEPGYIETRPASARADEDEEFFAANEGPRFCRDCRHYGYDNPDSPWFHTCARPRKPRIDLVTGEPIAAEPLEANAQRNGGGPGFCSPLGHHWQPREGQAE